ncbi:hypothetical protein DAI22_05g108401 [Oryza sativa Japonica Group]|nr:hypothetical protein DAI22_05g108401 [Oryza sativa Japonica Group]
MWASVMAREFLGRRELFDARHDTSTITLCSRLKCTNKQVDQGEYGGEYSGYTLHTKTSTSPCRISLFELLVTSTHINSQCISFLVDQLMPPCLSYSLSCIFLCC